MTMIASQARNGGSFRSHDLLTVGGLIAISVGFAWTIGVLTPVALAAQPSSAAQSAEDRVILITGSTDGLGREVALDLAAAGTHIIVHGRNQERGLEVVRLVEQAGGSARFYQADLADLQQVRELAESVLRDYERLDVLVNNAGIWLTAEQGRQTSADGHELHFAVNYLSHYLLTRLLLPLITETPSARIVNVASGAQQPIDFDDVMLEQNYSDGRGYAQSKLAQILFTIDLARELESAGVKVNALHPATMMNTTMVLSRGATSRSSVEEGVAAVMHLITAPEVGTGQYYNGTREGRANAQAYDEAARERLRRLSDELTGAPPARS
jgi:NAD(P)-dependent dehydrogenase (short-subunit alcohol dehydrogenase family)